MKNKIILLIVSVLFLFSKTTSAFTVSISSSVGNTSCQFQDVEFNATVSGCNDYLIQWYVNGNYVFSSNVVPYVTNSLSNGDSVWCVATSSTCLPNTATSNIITMTVIANQPPSVLVNALPNPSCAGSNVTITATPFEAGIPSLYQWTIDGIPAGPNSSTFSLTTLPPGIHNIQCTITSGEACDTVGPVFNPVAVGNFNWLAVQYCLWTARGVVYFDINGNGIHDAGEQGLNNKQILQQPPGTTLLTWNNGTFTHLVPNGAYLFSPVIPPGWHLSSSPSTYNIATPTFPSSMDFGLHPDSETFQLASTDVYGIIYGGNARCNTVAQFSVYYQNIGLSPASGTIQYIFDTLMTYVSATPPPFSISGNTLTWNYSNLSFNQSQTINISFLLPGSGNTVTNTSSIIAVDSLGNTIDSSGYVNSQLILCALDPNDKTVNPEGTGAQHYTLMNSPLDYTIHFQNTGNAPAYRVEITDTLSASLDISSLQIIASSHQMSASVEGTNILHFILNNIVLPDSSSNEPASHGYVVFRIKPLAGLPDLTVINNTSHIFFDLNTPVATNTTINTMTNILLNVPFAENENNYMTLFPNPATNQLTVTNERFEISNVEINDVLGQIVFSHQQTYNSQKQITIDVSKLNSGIYFVKMKTGNGEKTQKLIVQR